MTIGAESWYAARPGGLEAMAATRSEVLTLLRTAGPSLTALGVKRLGLFGSFVRDEQDPDSDVDILVEFEPRLKTFDNFLALATFLEELLGRDVELVTPESLSPYLGPKILTEVEYVPFAA